MQAPISIRGKEIVDLSLRDSLREEIDDEIELHLHINEYTQLLKHAGKIPRCIPDDEWVKIMCKGKYRHIYTAGGHMIKHIDTITSPSHIGTLVIIEQKASSGGHLVIDPSEEEDEYSHREGVSCIIRGCDDMLIEHNIYDDGEPHECDSAIIPLNVPHLVTHVKEGIRISRTYEIHVDPNSVQDIEIQPLTHHMLDITGIQHGHWDKDLIRKYTKGNNFIVYPSNPDLIEKAILRMIFDTHKILRFFQSVVVEYSDTEDREFTCYHNNNRCTVIGSPGECLSSNTEYNDSGYTTTRYYIANLMEIDLSS